MFNRSKSLTIAVLAGLALSLTACGSSPEYQDYKRDVLWNHPHVSPATYTGGVMGQTVCALTVMPLAATMDFLDQNEMIRNEEETRAYRIMRQWRWTGGHIVGTPFFWLHEIGQTVTGGGSADDAPSEMETESADSTE